ncbi:IclR family transcriptional regulator [Rhodococcus wratislaviensis]|uniref:Glycerol operon regulatory protein n=1 Tax=Rhodococcus wratislaviensis NBRC 100605 TaxID=1219028 RepID=X0QYJ5_RHOWR|nr:IclR family transcriptional regulator [Rhodococcus wratislaviensis]GAF43690.1 putative transcriptional regulator [Rhodococcus wratislaviensis NBRC 100605]
MEEQPAAARGVQTALRAISILEVFSTSRPALTLSEISEEVGLAVPTTHRLLKALVSRNLVVLDPESKRYSLGHGVMSLAQIIMQRDDLLSIAYPSLERLRNETSETVSLQNLVGDQRVAVSELASPHPIRMASGVGTPYTLVRGAAGKAILAFMSPKDIARLVPSSTSPTELLTELQSIRDEGYATSIGEVVAGASSLAAPIINSSRQVCAAINITGPADRFTQERVAHTAPLLLEVSANITRQLGGVAHPTHTSRALELATRDGRSASVELSLPRHP